LDQTNKIKLLELELSETNDKLNQFEIKSTTLTESNKKDIENT
jgi:hypothetical protein